MNSSYTAIRNHEALVKFLGKWPSFDDFEVASMLLERIDDEECPAFKWTTITIKLFGFRNDVAVESPDRNNCLIIMQFGGLENMTLNGWNHQNAINGFVVNTNWSERLKRDQFTVELIQGFGVGTKFDCCEMDLISVTPTVPGPTVAPGANPINRAAIST